MTNFWKVDSVYESDSGSLVVNVLHPDIDRLGGFVKVEYFGELQEDVLFNTPSGMKSIDSVEITVEPYFEDKAVDMELGSGDKEEIKEYLWKIL